MELPRPPDDPEAKNIIDKLAQFVARNGPEFEKMTKTKQEGNPKFAFLFGGDNYAYYDFKVRAEQQILRNTGGQQPPGRTGQQSWQQPPGAGGWGPPGGGQGPMGSQGGPGGPGGPPPGPGWGQQWRPNSPGVGGPPMGPNMGGPNMGPGPGMSSGGSKNYSGGYGNGGDYRGPGSDYGGPGYGGAGPNSGPPGGFGRFDESPNRRGILGGPPPGNNQGPNCWVGQMPNPPPQRPDTSMLDGQIATVKASIKTLEDQIVQSESNLTAQWTVLQQQERDTVQDAVAKARESQLEEQSRSCNVKLSELENLLQPIIETCTKDSISSGKSWIFQHGTNFNSNQVICDYLALKGTKESSPFSQKLHLIYLVNDVLHHCVRKNNETLKAALEAVAVPMYCAAADRAEEEDVKKLTKLMSLWESKNKFFSEEKLNDMLNPGRTIKRFRSKLQEDFPELVKPQEQGTTSTYNGYKQQHEQFVNHANNSIDEQQKQLEALEQELVVINMNYEETLKNWQKVNPQASQGNGGAGGGGRRSRWDRTAAQQAAVSQQGGGWDMSRPPPHMSTPPPHLMQPKIPSLPYFELPAGLMVPLVKMEDSGYKPIDPSLIRLPPPQPPNERLLAAVELFYAPPSHERPRDPEGWERLGLYEWARDKQDAVQKKKEAIENGTRSPSPPQSPAKTSREESPEQTVPGEEEVPKRRKRYRSRTSSKERHRSRSRSKDRRRSRTRSKSRESTPVPGEDDEGRRSRTRSRSRSRSGERRGRRRNDSERSRGGGRDLSPTGSGSPDGGALPSFLTRRSPTPPGGQLGGSNKGHQMMQKMGWKGAGLGSQESGITEPISGGEVRDKQDQYKGMGIEKDPFEDFRKMRAGGYYKRVKDYQGK